MIFFNAEPLYDAKKAPKNHQQALWDAKNLHIFHKVRSFSFLNALCHGQNLPFSGVETTLILSNLAFFAELFWELKILQYRENKIIHDMAKYKT